MRLRMDFRRVFTLGVLLIGMLGCTLLNPGSPSTKPGPTPTPTPVKLSTGGGGSAGGGSGSDGGGSGGDAGGGAGAGQGGGSGANNGSGDTTSQISGPFVVKQIETLGHETISGQVCSLTQPFTIPVVAPKVTFAFSFVPASAANGTFTYAYSIPSAGESHDAKGSYVIGPASEAGALQLAMTGADHVVFKGFDGNMPARYKFELLPSDTTGCP